jgi:hypothetical protein
MPQSGKQPRQYSCVVESLWDNSEFIQAGFHIGRYVLAVVDTEADRENINTLYSHLESTLTQIKVSG